MYHCITHLPVPNTQKCEEMFPHSRTRDGLKVRDQLGLWFYVLCSPWTTDRKAARIGSKQSINMCWMNAILLFHSLEPVECSHIPTLGTSWLRRFIWWCWMSRVCQALGIWRWKHSVCSRAQSLGGRQVNGVLSMVMNIWMRFHGNKEEDGLILTGPSKGFITINFES